VLGLREGFKLGFFDGSGVSLGDGARDGLFDGERVEVLAEGW
jgi:hypothetical protein